MSVHIEKVTIKAALPKGENPLPFFRNSTHDLLVTVKDNVPLEYQKLLGLECGFRILPYSMQDRYDTARTQQEVDAAILENEYLKATFLTSLGGRLISLYDKKKKKELLYNNKSIQVANLAIRDAWFAGGIEWNIGQYGHGFSTSSSVFASIQSDEEGEEFLRIYDYERCKELWWHIDFHLPHNSPFLYSYVEIHNLNKEKTSLYYWTNTAVKVNDKTRIFASSDEALYLDPYTTLGRKEYGYMKSPRMDIHPNIDTSYPNQFPNSNEYFFICDKDEMPWEVSIGEDGNGFCECSTSTLGYRKMFCWGNHAGGKRWQRYLSPETEDEYIELQAGLSPSQLHGLFLDGNSSISWTQAFGSISVDPKKAHNENFCEAKEEISHRLSHIITISSIMRMNEKCKNMSKIPPKRMIQKASGWGYIQQLVEGITLPPAFLFKEDSIGEQEKPYIEFIHTKKFPFKSTGAIPFVHPACSDFWKNLFIQAIENTKTSEQDKIRITYYLGIIYMEQDSITLAQTLWIEVMNSMPDAWTARNLAILSLRWNYREGALYYYKLASTLPGFFEDAAIAEEYLTLLLSDKKIKETQSLFDCLPSNWLSISEKLRMLRAQLAALEKNSTLIKELIFDTELAHIKEGETPLNELWVTYNAINYANTHGIPLTKEIEEKVKELYPIPVYLDFNMFT